jgi:hypothetical protein
MSVIKSERSLAEHIGDRRSDHRYNMVNPEQVPQPIWAAGLPQLSLC